MNPTDTDSRTVKSGHYVGLKFAEGWLFLNVLETEEIELKPWILLNENDERGPLAPALQSSMERPTPTVGSEDNEFLDEVGRELLEPQNSEKQVAFQLLVGVAPSRMQIYPRFGRDTAPNLVGGAESSNPQTPITGYDSPYNNPTSQGEFFVLNSVKNLALQPANPSFMEAYEARVSIHVNKFKYAVVDDIETMAKFIEGSLNFRDHAMGLGAKDNDQMEAPGWVMEHFGDSIMSTNDIIDESQTFAAENSASGDSNTGGQLIN